MNFNFTDMLFALSYGLDTVEHDLLGVATHHGARVALICVHMGHALRLSEEDLLDLAGCALLHDNALTEYLQSEHAALLQSSAPDIRGIRLHCVLGERNLSHMPFHGNVRDTILYHHERADGNGPFGKTWRQVPLYARLIHLADQLDTHFALGTLPPKQYPNLRADVQNQRGIQYDTKTADCFLSIFDDAALLELHDGMLTTSLERHMPRIRYSYTNQQLIEFASVFAVIIDYKSRFTRKHSIDIAKKARKLGEYYNYSPEKCAMLYLAGALHDVGKLMVKTSILEKPGPLTDEEFEEIKMHAYYTHVILDHIEGLEQIASWAANHHEKLDGSGYPFGKTAKHLSHEDRMIACLDIYQALTEDRPYRKGMRHEQAMPILFSFGERHQLDAAIIHDIDICFGPHPSGSASPQ